MAKLRVPPSADLGPDVSVDDAHEGPAPDRSDVDAHQRWRRIRARRLTIPASAAATAGDPRGVLYREH
jgi:hypothetical protein